MKTTRAVAFLCLMLAPILLAQQTSTPQPPRPTVRFHHVHYLVDDPGAALGPAVENLRGTRALLPELGVGVRVGREYVLFDRAKASVDLPSDVRPLGVNAPAEAIAWLERQGITVDSSAITLPAATALPADAAFDHLGFAADDLRAVLARMTDKPIAVSENVARFRLPSGSIIEIVRDRDRPDTHWCPMHPDIRRPGAEKCPRCGMLLVPIPPPRVGEYRMDVTVMPRRGGGATGLELVIRDPESAKPVPTLIEVHERQLHLFIVSRDLETFAHVHPDRRSNGAFAIRHELPPGAYGVMADFLPATGTSQMLQRVIVTPGYTGSLFAAPALTPGALEQTSGGLRIALDRSEVRARRPSLLRFQISDASTNQPVKDLEPFLGAAGHLLVVSPDLTTAFHAHPDGGLTAGPEVTFDPIFPAPGLYKMWVQFQRKGQVVTVPFVVSVE
jgi:hypothetical protein